MTKENTPSKRKTDHEDGEPMWRIKVIPLSYLITSTGYTHRALARKLGIRVRTLDSWISGKAAPNLDQRKQLAKILRCEVGMIHSAVAENQNRWKKYQEFWEASRTEDSRTFKFAIIELIVQIIVSVATALITTLILLGDI